MARINMFDKYKLVKQKLIPYGFQENKDEFILKKLIKNGEFEFTIRIMKGNVTLQLVDTDFGDEFSLDRQGSFSAELNAECEKILLDLREKCFEKQWFIFAQVNRLAKLINEKYGVIPEFLWDKTPDFGVFRNHQTKKWFGLVGNIAKNKITGDQTDEVEILNLNLKGRITEFNNKVGIYPAYHMNKKNWVSIILDDTLTDDDIMWLIDISFINSSK